MFGIEAALYSKIFHGLVFVLCLFIVIKYSTSSNNNYLLQKQPVGLMVSLGVLLILFIGLRPINGRFFGDMAGYAWSYKNLSDYACLVDFGKDWLFGVYTVFCKSMAWPVELYFLGIELGYIGSLVWACKNLLWESTWTALLFCISAFSFFTYGVNGLRNGLACSMIILAISFVAQYRNYFVAILIAFCAMGIHRSTTLPIVSCIGALAIIKRPKIALYIWLAAIPVSLIAENSIIDMFTEFGFDDRMDRYKVLNLNESFSSTGFRWDFLLYSAMPVLLTWYVHKRVDETGGYKEDESTALADATSMRVFNILSGTYILANSFWILVITANFSNRFAYLSWFLYPVVLAYAFLRLHIWNDQDRKCAWAILAHAGFTFGMFLIGKV